MNSTSQILQKIREKDKIMDQIATVSLLRGSVIKLLTEHKMPDRIVLRVIQDAISEGKYGF